MKGQVSVEMLLVVGLGLALVGIYMIYGFTSVDSYKKENDFFLARDSLEKIGETAEFVALQGYPAKQKINICFPLSLSNCSISNETISCNLISGQTVDYTSNVRLNGTLPNNSGCWDILIEAHNSVVNLSVS